MQFLLLALVLTWLAWLAARRQVARQLAAREEVTARRSCVLEAVEDDGGRGFLVTTGDGVRSDSGRLDWDAHGLRLLDVDMATASDGADVAPGFNAGNSVELIPSDDGTRLEVWDAGMTVRAGAVTPADARDAARWLDEGSVGDCIVVREDRSGTRRTALRLLLVHAQLDVESTAG